MNRPIVDGDHHLKARPRPTQKQRVLQLLLENDEVCGHAVFYGRERIPRFGAHLDRLKRDGYVWTKRPCDQHDHEGTGWLYRLVAVPEKRQDAGCVVCGGILGHVSTCRDLNAGQLPLGGG